MDNKEHSTSEADIEVVAGQPVQLELFRLTSAHLTNAFEFYESIPRFTVWGDRARYFTPDGQIASVKRAANGTALPIEKAYDYQGKPYILEIKPALIKQRSGGYKAIFPGIREEIVEFVLYKLAVSKGYFTMQTESKDVDTDNFTLFTSIYEIQQELKKRQGAKTNSYSNTQVREALEVLQEATLHLKSKQADTDLKFQLISEFGHYNKHYDETGKKATLYIRFNAMVSKNILARNWRAINYESVLKDESYLCRWFRKILSLKFTYASQNKTFNLKLSSIINLSGISPYGSIRDNLVQVKKALNSLDIVERILVKADYQINPATKRKLMCDATIFVYPSKSFVHEQVLANIHDQKLEEVAKRKTGQLWLGETDC